MMRLRKVHSIVEMFFDSDDEFASLALKAVSLFMGMVYLIN